MASRFSELRKGLTPVPTYTQFAAKVEPCSDQQIRRLEAGFVNPGIQLAYRVAEALGKSVYDVFPPKGLRRGKKAQVPPHATQEAA